MRDHEFMNNEQTRVVYGPKSDGLGWTHKYSNQPANGKKYRFHRSYLRVCSILSHVAKRLWNDPGSVQ